MKQLTKTNWLLICEALIYSTPYPSPGARARHAEALRIASSQFDAAEMPKPSVDVSFPGEVGGAVASERFKP